MKMEWYEIQVIRKEIELQTTSETEAKLIIERDLFCLDEQQAIQENTISRQIIMIERKD